MKAPSLLKEVQRAEKAVSRELEQLQEESAARILECKTKVRKKVKETLEEDPQQRLVRENIEHLQLRLELLRNMRMNWKNFEKYASERGIELRINQFSALQHLIHFLETGEGEEVTEDADPARALMAFEVQPTGAGKTGAFAIETALLDVPTLILVPFDNLVEQTKEDLMKIGGIAEEDIGLLYGGTKEFGRKVTVATYAGHAAQMRRKGDYANHIQNNVKYCICDEVHTSLGDRTQESLLSIDGMGNGELTDEEMKALESEQYVLEHLDEQVSQKALKVGFTATPKASAKHVSQYFPHFLGRVYHKDMVEAGILVPYRIVQCDGSVSEGEVGQYVSQELEVKILKREKIYEKLLGEYAEALHTYQKMKSKNEYPLRGMAFCTNHKECEKFAKEAKELGLRCEIVTGKEASGTKGKDVINAAKEKICAGEIDIIVTVEKLCAGFNFPEINAVIWARVTSMAKTIQGIGRGGRSYKEGDMRKDCCWVFETNWTLKKNAKRGKKPLRLADALIQNGEDPDAICSMADGTKLDYNKRLPEIDEDGVITINDQICVGINRYAKKCGVDVTVLLSQINKLELKPIEKALAKSTIIDVYLKSEIDALPLIIKSKASRGSTLENGTILIDGVECIGTSKYSETTAISYALLNKAVEESGLKPKGKVKSGTRYVDAYSKIELDQLQSVQNSNEAQGNILLDDGTILIGNKLCVALSRYAANFDVTHKPLIEAVSNAKLKSYGKVLTGGRHSDVYLKSQVDSLPFIKDAIATQDKILGKEDVGIQIGELECVGLARYASSLRMEISRLEEAVTKAKIKPTAKARSSGHIIDVFEKDKIDQLPALKEIIGLQFLSDDGSVVIDGENCYGSRKYSLKVGCSDLGLANAIKREKITPCGKGRSGANIVDVYRESDLQKIDLVKRKLGLQ